jgi:hypothetical protein
LCGTVVAQELKLVVNDVVVVVVVVVEPKVSK